MADTDCRSEEGVTVGLVDSLIAVSRVLSRRALKGQAVAEALRDLASDEDVKRIMEAAHAVTPSNVRRHSEYDRQKDIEAEGQRAAR